MKNHSAFLISPLFVIIVYLEKNTFTKIYIMSVNWNGVFPALTTKFTADDQLDLPMFKKNLDAQLRAGVHGIILGGTLGESSTLTTEEKSRLVQFAVENVEDRIPVILNIAEGATSEALKQAELAEKWGVKD